MINVIHFLKDHAYRNIPLSFEEAYEVGNLMIKACIAGNLGNVTIAQIQSTAILCSLHNKATYSWYWDKEFGEDHGHKLPTNAAEQIAGICASVFEQDLAKSEFGFLCPDVDYAMDNCGMGGDLVVTANVSTIAAFIAAAAGIAMCKHGSPANADKGRHGSSDFISLCGIDTFSDKKQVEKAVSELKFGYTEALDTRYKRIHLETHNIAKLPHMNDIIGPITNPLTPSKMTHRILGVNHLIPPSIVAQAYIILNRKGITNLKKGLFVRGFIDGEKSAGIDEVSICEGGTQVVELRNEEYKENWLHAKDFGLSPVSVESISPPYGTSKGNFSLGILKREITGAPAQMVAANAALILYLAEYSQDLKECYKLAKDKLSSGEAYEKMLAVREMLPKEE